MTVSDCFSFQLYSCWFCCNTHQAVLFLLMSALSRIKAVWSQFRLLGSFYFTLIGLHAMWLTVFASVCLNNLSELIIRHEAHGCDKIQGIQTFCIKDFFCCVSCAYIHRWKLNDSFILPRPGSRYSLMGGNLHISHLNKEEDVGIYQCLASNSFGTIVSREASLHIACKSILYLTKQCVITLF